MLHPPDLIGSIKDRIFLLKRQITAILRMQGVKSVTPLVNFRYINITLFKTPYRIKFTYTFIVYFRSKF